eukprot:TRINITY_DN2652_c0_g1_i1.p1 TRINITY_DN2652_c0_g1~~TRINITY_DN2652_c0_g1_i1.p1  ORF type:complete len:319 (+),score=24.57 TRINITY_DN2652_c0_g1_i1:95-1051(+)
MAAVECANGKTFYYPVSNTLPLDLSRHVHHLLDSPECSSSNDERVVRSASFLLLGCGGDLRTTFYSLWAASQTHASRDSTPPLCTFSFTLLDKEPAIIARCVLSLALLLGLGRTDSANSANSCGAASESPAYNVDDETAAVLWSFLYDAILPVAGALRVASAAAAVIKALTTARTWADTALGACVSFRDETTRLAVVAVLHRWVVASHALCGVHDSASAPSGTAAPSLMPRAEPRSNEEQRALLRHADPSSHELPLSATDTNAPQSEPKDKDKTQLAFPDTTSAISALGLCPAPRDRGTVYAGLSRAGRYELVRPPAT